ncbi:glycosyltransferase [Pseudanabaena sp. FACHB-2040]|uniref:glycosyltransferase n=1 Tax=Pseudanabaena sp. FACHB-2040 TaxID=2692859 RepID=UPI001681CEF0|nr:glycosyltransferase [Pseudanabaena sp. FACHB-2040]MBD2257538.1 glycosyltransferase family 1 protein [Pseudanabaena sp. FACHB-2040]
MQSSRRVNNRKRVLVISQRDNPGKDLVANSVPFEFEDWIIEMDSADIVTPQHLLGRASTEASKVGAARETTGLKRSLKEWLKTKLQSNRLTKGVFKLMRKIAWTTSFKRFVAPKVSATPLDQEYDLLYVILTEPWEILSLQAIPNWREKCRYAVAHFVELWQKEIDDLKILHREYAEFDKIYSNTFYTTEEITEATGRPCEYLPFTIDAVKFCPYPNPPERFIKVSYIGRRSQVTHAALMELAEKESFFYLYDTAKVFRTPNHREHRSLLANQLKRTTYFFANRSKINDSSTAGRPPEFGWRFFEGLAAGTVVLGTPPDTEIFEQYFDWPDAVIRLPFDMENIADVLAELDSQPERVAQIRRDNLVNVLKRYDWLYTWKHILEDANLALTLPLQRRKEKLKDLVELVNADFSEIELPTPLHDVRRPVA